MPQDEELVSARQQSKELVKDKPQQLGGKGYIFTLGKHLLGLCRKEKGLKRESG